MNSNNVMRFKYFLILSVAGLVVAILSALEGRVEWLASFCGFFGDGCSDTAQFQLLGIPVWLWGILYYVVLIGALFFWRPTVFWLVMIGMGVELSLLWILVSLKLSCVFCLINAVVVVVLFAFCLDRKRIWQAMAVSLLVFPLSHILLSDEMPAFAFSGPEQRGDDVMAKIGDDTISRMELEAHLASKIYRLQQEIYFLKRERLEELITETLLTKEAEKRGLTVEQLIDTLSPGKVQVTDEEVEAYYQKNRSRFGGWDGHRKELRERIREYLQHLKDLEETKKMTDPLREHFPVKVYLKEPPLPFSNVSVDDSPVLGPADAAVTIVEFSDYLCPVCRKAHKVTKEIREIYAGKIRWVFKDFPLKIHPGSKKLAEAAQCAGDQGKFWEFQDLLFAASQKPDYEELKGFAHQLDLDVNLFGQCYESEKYLPKVKQEIQTARNAGVGSTPSFIINGRLNPGSLSLEDFKKLIDEELKSVRADHTRTD